MKDPEQIKKDVVNQLSWDSRVNANNIQVKAKDGTVILTGSVPTYASKFDAQSIARLVLGVKSVDNRLTVEFPASFNVPSDETIRSSIKQSLTWSTEVDETEIDVSVSSGVVTLEGSVGSYWEKISAGSEARDVTGVIGFTNKLAVVPTQDITDEVIGERVLDRIAQNTQVDVDSINVKVVDGEVTLSGNVRSWSQWRNAHDAALFTTGVINVEDNLLINYA